MLEKGSNKEDEAQFQEPRDRESEIAILHEIFPIFDLEVIKTAVGDFDTIDLAYEHLSEFYEKRNSQKHIEHSDEEQKEDTEALEIAALSNEINKTLSNEDVIDMYIDFLEEAGPISE